MMMHETWTSTSIRARAFLILSAIESTYHYLGISHHRYLTVV